MADSERMGGGVQMMTVFVFFCFLPVAAVSGSLPWRSASSHWYKATDEPHAEKHGAEKTKKGNKKTKTAQCQKKCTQKKKAN